VPPKRTPKKISGKAKLKEILMMDTKGSSKIWSDQELGNSLMGNDNKKNEALD
jgi:hypothetical protein